MEESWKASTFLTSNFSLDFSKRPGRLYPPRTWTLYKMEKGNFYYETFESSIRRPLTPFVEWDFHKLGVALRRIGKIHPTWPSEIKNRILIIVYFYRPYLSTSLHLLFVQLWKSATIERAIKDLKAAPPPNFPNQDDNKETNFDGVFARAPLFPR